MRQTDHREIIIQRKMESKNTPCTVCVSHHPILKLTNGREDLPAYMEKLEIRLSRATDPENGQGHA